MIPTLQWHNNQVLMLDQRIIPGRIEWYTCRGYKDVIRAIKDMVIRGAPAIGVAAAMGLAMGASSIRARTYSGFLRKFGEISVEMRLARPTAVNLAWAVERMGRLVGEMADRTVDEIKAALRTEASTILDEDIDINRRIGRNGRDLVTEGATILTHCNAGSLATAGYGTALGVIRAAWEQGKNIRVIADETRPWLQGLRLTAFELMEDNIDVCVIADSAAGYFMRRGEVDLVITGADRIAANGDVANKIGTYQVAILAHENRIPFYVAAPRSTIDFTIPNGDHIPVEERDPLEITRLRNQDMGPPGVKALNPAFDITPAGYVNAIITEENILLPPLGLSIKGMQQ